MRHRIAPAIALFPLVAFALDRGAGSLLDTLLRRTQPPHLCESSALGALDHRDADVFFFGSSRAKFHYVPEIFARLRGERAFNAGCVAEGIYVARAIEGMLLARGTGARRFILETDPADLYAPVPRDAFPLAPLVDEPGVQPLLDAYLSPVGRLKLWSRSYRYNSLAAGILARAAAGGRPSADGYQPAGGSMEGATELEENPGGIPRALRPDAPMRPAKQRLFRRFLREARDSGIPVVLVRGPRLRLGQPVSPPERRAIAWFEELAREEGARYLQLDEEDYPALRAPGLYRDHAHLNGEGAAIFTRLLHLQLGAD